MRTIVAGVDCGTERCGVVALVRAEHAPLGWSLDWARECEAPPHLTTKKWGKNPRVEERLAEMARLVDLALVRIQPDYVCVENPYVGNGKTHPILVATFGAVLANAAQLCGAAAEQAFIPTWKKAAGVAGKPKSAMVPVARQLGYHGDDGEIIDACGIALLAARRWEESR